jgi:hypothetical protein
MLVFSNLGPWWAHVFSSSHRFGLVVWLHWNIIHVTWYDVTWHDVMCYDVTSLDSLTWHQNMWRDSQKETD